MASPTPFNISVIGYGFSAKIFHIPLLLPLPTFRLHSIVQRSPTPQNDSLKDFPGTKQFTDVDAMLQDPDVDLVVITTPPSSHFSLATKTLHARKHVVVEKPFTPSSVEARELAALATQQGKLLSVYQNRRWDGDFATVRDLVQTGRLGRVLEFHTHFDRYTPVVSGEWGSKNTPGVSAVFDLGSHLLDQVVLLFGMPRTVFGVVGSQREGAAERGEPGDGFRAVLRYASGVVVYASASVLSVEVEQPRFWVRGDKGSWVKRHLDCQEEQLVEGRKADEVGFGVEEQTRWGTLTTVDENGELKREQYEGVKPPTWAEFYKGMAAAMAGQGEVPVSAEQAADIIRLVELIIESSETGKALEV